MGKLYNFGGLPFQKKFTGTNLRSDRYIPLISQARKRYVSISLERFVQGTLYSALYRSIQGHFVSHIREANLARNKTFVKAKHILKNGRKATLSSIFKNVCCAALTNATQNKFCFITFAHCGLSNLRNKSLFAARMRINQITIFNHLNYHIMKKIYYKNVRYSAITKFQHKSGEYTWVRENNLTIAEAKRMYVSVKQHLGAEAHLVGERWFYGHLPHHENGTIEAILLEEVKPFYFE